MLDTWALFALFSVLCVSLFALNSLLICRLIKLIRIFHQRLESLEMLWQEIICSPAIIKRRSDKEH